ncbi:tetratricopeptide repeat protein [Streptomyces naphthomycinicus]|uniref:tetratricopeptide repeat protein n=1 Tax=Streptomyces naphthomycinicus TaxID=2872625 RepID=UPI001CED0F8E|nr:tetratricopeptide repeat protein [Streptomyces sp. TML10]
MRQHAVASGFARVFQAAGDMVVYGGGEPYRLSSWSLTGPAEAVSATWPSGESVPPSALLRAGSAVVDFTGRTAERARLRRWRDSADTMGVCLVHGPGGQGKTRLALQVAADWQAQGWFVLGAFHRRDRQAAPAFSVPVGLESSAGVLVVVDYAERWDTSDLLALLGDTHVGARRSVRVRVLLLARPTGPWWQNLSFRINRDLGLVAERLELPPVEDEPGVSRAELFAAARDRFAELMNVPEARTAAPPRALAEQDDYRLVLSVHMAALATVLTARQSAEPPGDPVEVSAYLLAREHDHWLALHHRSEGAVEVAPHAMGQLVYTATLTGPLGYDEGKSAVERAGIESTQVPAQMLRDHARCYPAFPGRPVGGGPATVLEPLYPDRLGEDYLALSTEGHDHDHPPDPWTDRAPARLLAPRTDPAGASAETGPGWTRHALTTLIEAAARWPHLAFTQLYPLLHEHPELALSAGGPALVTLAHHPHIDLGLLEIIDELLPWQRTDLDIAAAAIADRLSRYRLDTASGDARRALVHENTALRFSNVGQYERALAHSADALSVYRELAESHRGAHIRDYARAVGNHTALLAEAGLREAALTHSFEALAVQQELAELDQDAPPDGLARATAHHAQLLAEEGRHTAALHYSEQAVALLRRLTESQGASHLADLATVLSNHAVRLAAEGRPEEALSYSEEALALRRELVRRDRTAYLPDLAASLDTHAGQLDSGGRLMEALSCSEESLALCRELADLNPGAHKPALARSAGNHAPRLAEGGRLTDALLISEEALIMYRELAKVNRSAHLREFAASMSNHAVLLDKADRPADALSRSGEALALRRELAELDRTAHLYGYATSAAAHTMRLAEAGRMEEALACSSEAVALHWELAERDQDAHLPALAALMRQRGAWLVDAGRPEDALSCSEDAAALYSELAERDRDAYLPDFAAALHDLARRLAVAGQSADALSYSERALFLHQELVEQGHDGHLMAYVQCATGFGQLLLESSRFGEAVRPLVNAMRAAWQLPQEDRWTMGMSAGFLHLAYNGDPYVVSAEFRAVTGLEMPDWLKRPEV